MSIKFICSCGKHLRAGDDMAARRAMCPRCGAPVGVPSLRPTHAGTLAAPLTPQERRRLRLSESSDTLTAEPAATLIADVPSFDPADVSFRKRIARDPWPRQLEACWPECLAYPFFNYQALLTLAFTLTLLSGAFVLLIPQLPHVAEMSSGQWLTCASLPLASLLFLACAGAIVECALKSALAGKGPGTYWPNGPLAVLKSGLRWLICFVAGPIIPLTLAGHFWLHGGELTGLDWLIVTELIVSAFAYWLLAGVCSVEGDRFRDANPVRVAQLLQRLRGRAVMPVLIAPGLMGVHGAIAFFALSALHQHISAWLLLLCCWGSGLFAIAFLFRTLGVWCYHSPANAERQGP